MWTTVVGAALASCLDNICDDIFSASYVIINQVCDVFKNRPMCISVKGVMSNLYDKHAVETCSDTQTCKSTHCYKVVHYGTHVV